MKASINRNILIFLKKYLLVLFLSTALTFFCSSLILFRIGGTGDELKKLIFSGFVVAFIFTLSSSTCLVNIYAKGSKNFNYRILSFLLTPTILGVKLFLSAVYTPFFYVMLIVCSLVFAIQVLYFIKFLKLSNKQV